MIIIHHILFQLKNKVLDSKKVLEAIKEEGKKLGNANLASMR